MSDARPYTQVKRAQAQGRTRAGLLDAAERVFFEGRWEDASLDAIAGEAGVTKQTLLRHFGSKAGLLEAGARRGLDAVAAQRLGAPTDDIPGAVENLLDHYDDEGERALKLGAMAGGPEIAEIGRRARALHHEWVDHAFGAWLRRAPAAERAQRRAAVITLCDVHAWQLLSRDLGMPRPEVRATLILALRRILEEDDT